MDKYSKADIAKIINDCEILILPENATLEDALSSRTLLESEIPRVQADQEVVQPKLEEETEDFERIFWNTKVKQNQNVNVSLSVHQFPKIY